MGASPMPRRRPRRGEYCPAAAARRESRAVTFEIRPLTPERAGDYLAFFDHHRGPAFSDNPEWATCYCQFYHTPRSIDWRARGGNENREAMTGRILTGEMEGFLAYETGAQDGTAVIGWLNAQPRNKLPHCFERMRIEPTAADVPDFKAAQVLCFVIHPQWRRRGVARALLFAACESLARRGFESIEAYPFNAGDSEDATDHYHGTLSMFIDADFEIIREDSELTVVRKTLTPR